MSWQSMKNETDLWFRTYSPNPPTEKLINIRKLWVDFQSINMQKYINDYVKITQNYNIKNNSNVKVYVYSGYQDKIYYGETCKEIYSLDWNKMRTLGIDYAVCGYNESKEVAIKQKNILGDVKLIGSVMYHKGQILESLKKKFQYQIENKEVFDGGVMFFFLAAGFRSILKLLLNNIDA
ncbi:MAG: hypothetical protein H6629_11835 [Calditrichae bacterium]|nr:hypothetical protein [Calditrichia bacterium]